MAKLDLALVVRTVDQATRPLRDIQRTVKQVGRQTGLDRVGRDLGRTGRQMRVVSGEALALAGNLGGIAVAIGGFVGGFALRAFGSIEQLEIAFTSLLGSESKALEMVKQLTDFTAKTPFQLEDVGAAGKMLLSFGVAGDDLLDRLQLLGDIASGANVPLNELAATYGKTVSKGKAQTEELNQLSERGVPIIQALVDLHKDLGYEISKQDVYDAAAAGKITAQNIEDALRRMSAEGGLFFKQMELQSQSLFGLVSTVKDNIFLGLREVGERIEKTFGVKEGMRKFIAWLGRLGAELKKPFAEQTGAAREITRTIEDVVAVVGWLRAGLSTLADSLKDTGLDGWAMEFGYVRLAAMGLAGFLSLGFLSAVIGLFGPLASLAGSLGRVGIIAAGFLIANPMVALIAAIALAAALLYFEWDEVVKFLKISWWEIKNLFAEVGDFFGGLVPDWVAGSLGMIGVDAPGPGVGGLSGPAGAGVNVGGEVRVRFDGLPRGATVDVQSDNPAVPLDVPVRIHPGPI